MTAPATPRVSRRPSLPLIWVVPLVALIIAGWMVGRQFRNRGPEITIEFATAAGIEAGKTELEHKGVSIGVVRTVTLKNDLSGVLVQVRLTKAGAALARSGSQFWIVHPEVSFSGIRGLETLVTGVRLKVRPGEGALATHFRGLDHPPPIDDPSAGRSFVLRTDKLGGVAPEDPVYYRGVKVGVVETTRLADDAIAAVIRVRIYTPYIDLVRTNTQFWNVGGISLKMGLHGLEVRTNTLQSIIAGGVSFATPGGELSPTALENTEFVLHEEPEKEWLQWEPRIQIHPEESVPDLAKPESGGGIAPRLGQPSVH
jgi:paraquat-inducible protein B